MTSAARIGMRRISEINELYGGNEPLERLQRVGVALLQHLHDGHRAG